MMLSLGRVPLAMVVSLFVFAGGAPAQPHLSPQGGRLTGETAARAHTCRDVRGRDPHGWEGLVWNARVRRGVSVRRTPWRRSGRLYTPEIARVPQLSRSAGPRHPGRSESRVLQAETPAACRAQPRPRACREREDAMEGAPDGLAEALTVPPDARTKPVLRRYGIPAVEGVPPVVIINPDGQVRRGERIAPGLELPR